jgi:flagellar biosynthesis protein FlhG
VIQVSSDPSAIKSAYGLIKRMSARLGRRSFSILVSGVSEKEAMLIYTNMAQASQRYLAVPLNFIGYVPDDEFVRRAAHQGQSVIDSFSESALFYGFFQLAERLVVVRDLRCVWTVYPDNRASLSESNLNMYTASGKSDKNFLLREVAFG